MEEFKQQKSSSYNYHVRTIKLYRDPTNDPLESNLSALLTISAGTTRWTI